MATLFFQHHLHPIDSLNSVDNCLNHFQNEHILISSDDFHHFHHQLHYTRFSIDLFLIVLSPYLLLEWIFTHHLLDLRSVQQCHNSLRQYLDSFVLHVLNCFANETAGLSSYRESLE